MTGRPGAVTVVLVTPARRNRRAFSLIELTVTMVVLLALVGVAFVAFVRTEQTGSLEAAKTELSQASASTSAFQQGHGFFPQTPTALKQLEPGIDWTAGPATKDKQISFAHAVVSDTQVFGLALRADKKLCVTVAVPQFGSEVDVVRDWFEIGTGVDDVGVPRGACSGAAALTRSGDSINSW